MKIRRLWAVSRKEFLHVFRDARSLGMAIGIPMVMLLLFGYALTLDVDNVPMAVWDQSGTAESRDFVSRFDGSRYFAVTAPARDYAEIVRAIDSGRALTALVIPSDFTSRLGEGRATAQLIVDGSDAGTATLAAGYARVVGASYAQSVAQEALRRRGIRPAGAPVELRPRVWFNEDLESRNFIIPGLVAVIMMVIAALLTSLTMAREWERGTMEQLVSTPVRPSELVLGKLLPYFAIGMADVAIAVAMGAFLFHVPLRGSLGLLFGMSAVFLAGTLSLGMLVSVIARNQLLATQLAIVLTFLPSFLLSGFMYAIANMPAAVQAVTYVVPARYFIALLRGIYLKGIGLEILGAEAALLTVFGAAMVWIAIARFRKKVA